MQTLNHVVQKVLSEPSTLQELLHFLENAFGHAEFQRFLDSILSDTKLQQKVTEFALDGLEIPEVRQILERQVTDI
eukprot:CAMPEP_0172464866 /NCGR_PEP_ID=MMETSP1065-20121228/51810_1 /TAXON_ID=265537 /ORGANISM="Amphiprora paludosa, Strain CCMP125" /LENGTH=75 /DNA_ID=CAMNT_0013221223 /DNA_START=11 /DNA_END=235 /DNA_ORIENTATION=+